jgi:hypothetical protein
MEMLSKAMPFTALLPQVSSRLLEATLLLPDIQKRRVRRVGIITTTPIAERDIPPGTPADEAADVEVNKSEAAALLSRADDPGDVIPNCAGPASADPATS